jgi:two-component system, response regulator PdtaR
MRWWQIFRPPEKVPLPKEFGNTSVNPIMPPSREGDVSLRILVVEDELIVALDLEETLKGLGHEVIAVASTAREAIEAAGQHEPDVVLMDINLGPGPDGIEAARQISALLGIRSIFLSAYAGDRNQRRAETVGPIAFLKKPANTAELTKALGAAVESTVPD